MKYLKRFNHINEGRVPRADRIELYKDKNIIVVVPLTHDALKKYAHGCQWCINGDFHEWNDYHRGHSIIIQRNPKGNKIGVTGMIVPDEIFVLEKWDSGHYKFEDACGILGYNFESEKVMEDYYMDITSDINNFATDIVYYSSNGTYDMWDNNLHSFNYTILDVPNVTKEVVQIMDNFEKEFLKSEQIVESVNNEDYLKSHLEDLLVPFVDLGCYSTINVNSLEYSMEFGISGGMGMVTKEIFPQYFEELSILFESLNKLKNEYYAVSTSIIGTKIKVYKIIDNINTIREFGGTQESKVEIIHTAFYDFDVRFSTQYKQQIDIVFKKEGNEVSDDLWDFATRYRNKNIIFDGYTTENYNDELRLCISLTSKKIDNIVNVLIELCELLLNEKEQ